MNVRAQVQPSDSARLRAHVCRLCAAALEALFNDTSDCKDPVSVGMAVRSRGRGCGVDPYLPAQSCYMLTCPDNLVR